MADFIKKRKIVGIDIDEGCVIATEVIRRAQQVSLFRHAAAPSLAELKSVDFLKDADAVIGLPVQAMLLRSYHLPSNSPLRSSLNHKDLMLFLMHQNLPFRLEECCWDVFRLDSELNLIAAKKEVVEKYVSQVEAIGINCLGVTPSLIALFNGLIYNYSILEENRVLLIHIRNSAADFMIYERKHLWIYPIPISKKDLQASVDENAVKFATEVQRIFNIHSLQNPVTVRNTQDLFYLSGQGCSEQLVQSLKKVFAPVDVLMFDPFKMIAVPAGIEIQRQQAALSVGLGLSYLQLPRSIAVNLIQKRISKERQLDRVQHLRTVARVCAVAVVFILLILDIRQALVLESLKRMSNNTRALVSLDLPKAQAFKSENEVLAKTFSYLEKRQEQQKLYLRVLALISENKPEAMKIQELEMDSREKKPHVLVSGTVGNYEDINTFLSSLNKNSAVKEGKLLSSSSPDSASEQKTEEKTIDFKIRFDLAI